MVLWNLTGAAKASSEGSWISGIWAGRSNALVHDTDGLWLWDFSTGERSLIRTGRGQVSSAPEAGVWAVASWAESSGGRIRVGKWGCKQTTLLVQSKESFLGLGTVLQISRNGTRLVAPFFQQGCRVFDAFDGHVVWQREKLELGAQASLSPSGQHLFICSLLGTLEIIDLDGGKSIHHSLPQPGQRAILFPPEHDCVFIQQGEDTGMLNWRTNSAGPVFQGRPSSISDDGRWMVTQSRTRKLNLWTLPEARRVATFTSDTPILHTALSPDGRFLIAGDQRGGVYIFERA
jgi:WD40 repeat protein